MKGLLRRSFLGSSISAESRFSVVPMRAAAPVLLAEGIYGESEQKRKHCFLLTFPSCYCFQMSHINRKDSWITEWLVRAFAYFSMYIAGERNQVLCQGFTTQFFCCSCFSVQHILLKKTRKVLNWAHYLSDLRNGSVFLNQKPSKNFRTGPNGSVIIMSYYHYVL